MCVVNLVFQSAPAIAGGRCVLQGNALLPNAGFNPRPPLLAGDATLPAPVSREALVSIRARHCWRAMHKKARLQPGS